MPETSRTISASLAFADRIDRLTVAIGRTVAWVCGLHHVRETIPFARMMERITP